MGKAAGAVVGVFMVGSGAVAFLNPFMGGASEAAALGLMGVGMLFSSSMLTSRVGGTVTAVAKEA